MDNRPIGIFDSGVGGLTVFDAIQKRLPNESLLYLGDTARVPYGNRSASTIRKYSANATRLLANEGIKALVIACNTASAYAYEGLKDAYDFPVVGVIEPAAEDAAKTSISGKIGIIGTRGTVSSQSYPKAIQSHRIDAVISQIACPLFVPLAEEGWKTHDVTKMIIDEYFTGFSDDELDVLVLGCTHYPIIRDAIETSIRCRFPNLKVLDCASSSAIKLEHILTEQNLLADHTTPQYRFFATDDPARFQDNATAFLTMNIQKVEHVEITDV